jgi:hypothetical protein
VIPEQASLMLDRLYRSTQCQVKSVWKQMPILRIISSECLRSG